MTELLEYRDRFPIHEHTTNLINHSLRAMPAAVEDRVADYARTWAERGIRAWGEGWWTMPLAVGDQIGRIVGAPPGTVCMHQNVSIAASVVLSCFQRPGERNRIVYERENFPSVRYVYQARDDLEVVATDDVVSAIGERTLLVPVQHVLFKSAEIQDVETIVDTAHAAGAYVALAARAGPPRRHGHRRRARLRGGAQGVGGAADPLRLPPRSRHPARAALLHDRRRARARARPDRGDPRERRARALARRDGSLLALSRNLVAGDGLRRRGED